MPQLLYNINYNLSSMPNNPDGIIRYAVQKDSLDDIILIVPTGKLVRKYQMSFVRQYYEATNKPCSKPNIFTLQSFISNCFNTLFDSRKFRVISEAYRLALFEEAIEKGALNYFVREDRKPSNTVLKRLADLVYGLKEDGITLSDISKDVDNPDDSVFDIDRFRDIQKIYNYYQQLLGEKYLDYPEMLKLLNNFISREVNQSPVDALNLFDEPKNVSNPLDKIFPKNPIILLFGFSEFKQPEIEFLSKFARSSVPFAVNIDFSEINGPLFGNLRDTLWTLEVAGFKRLSLDEDENAVREQTFDNDLNKPRSIFLRGKLFNTEKNISNTGFSSIIKIIAAENRQEEVKSIAKLVKYLILEKNVQPSDICITNRKAETYSNLFREVFATYDIPVNISDRFPLAKSPLIVGIFSLLDVITRGFKREDIHRMCLNPYMKFQSDKNGTIDAYNLYNVALKLRIQGGLRNGGAKFWLKRLKGASESFGNRIKEFNDNLQADPTEINHITKEFEAIDKAYSDFTTLYNLLPKEKKNYSPEEFSKLIIEDIIEIFGIKEAILDFYHDFRRDSENTNPDERIRIEDEIEKDARALALFTDILSEITFILNDRDKSAKFKLDELVRKLKISVTGAKYQITEKQNYGVNITSIEQTRGIPFKVMILSGAIDGAFPIRYTPEIFLGKELSKSESRHKQTERLQFYQFLTNSNENLDFGSLQVYIFYPKAEEAVELVRSPFIDALLKVTTLEEDGCIYDLATIKKASKLPIGEISQELSKQLSELPWINTIASKGEVFNRIGQDFVETSTLSPIKNSKLHDIIDKHDLEKTTHFIEKYINENDEHIPGIIEIESLDEENIEYFDKLKGNPYSVSELETYASCPYKYFVRRILNIEEEEDRDITLSPLEKGNLFHIILFRFYKELQDRMTMNSPLERGQKGVSENSPLDRGLNGVSDNSPLERGLRGVLSLVKLEPQKKNDYRELLFKIAKDEIERIRYEHPFFELEENNLLGTEHKIGLLDIWLNNEIERIENGWNFSPALFEFGFGMKTFSEDKKSVQPVEIEEGLFLRGKTDRIEFLENKDEIRYLVADYKSSFKNISNNNSIKNGNDFQMPLYVSAIKKLLKDNFGIDAEYEGAVYYSLNPEYDRSKEEFLTEKFVLLSKEDSLSKYLDPKRILPKTKDETQKLIQTSIGFAKTYINDISLGNFPVEPTNNDICNYCDYKAVCRVSSLKKILMNEEIT